MIPNLEKVGLLKPTTDKPSMYTYYMLIENLEKCGFDAKVLNISFDRFPELRIRKAKTE